MKFAYLAAALLPLAFANPIALEAPTEDGLTSFEARNEDGLLQDGLDLFEESALEERDGLDELEDALNELFAEIEARSVDLGDEIEEEENEIEARSAGSIISSLKRIVKDIGGVNKALGRFGNKSKPSNSDALAVQRAAQKLQSDVNKAVGIAGKTGKLSTGASKKVFKVITKSVKPAALKSLAKFRAHRAGFKKSAFYRTVHNKLKTLAKSTVKLGKNLLADTKNKGIKKKGAKVLKQIKAAFIKTIKAYN